MADPSLRRAGPADAGAVAEVYLRSFHAALPTVGLAHSDNKVRGWVAAVMIKTLETWVAENGDGEIVGMMTLGDATLEHLYLLPEAQGRGLGARFVALAKERRPSGLRLYAFQVNERARRFYERQGFSLIELGDGSGNEEGQPDALYAWTPAPLVDRSPGRP